MSCSSGLPRAEVKVVSGHEMKARRPAVGSVQGYYCSSRVDILGIYGFQIRGPC